MVCIKTVKIKTLLFKSSNQGFGVNSPDVNINFINFIFQLNMFNVKLAILLLNILSFLLATLLQLYSSATKTKIFQGCFLDFETSDPSFEKENIQCLLSLKIKGKKLFLLIEGNYHPNSIKNPFKTFNFDTEE